MPDVKAIVVQLPNHLLTSNVCKPLALLKLGIKKVPKVARVIKNVKKKKKLKQKIEATLFLSPCVFVNIFEGAPTRGEMLQGRVAATCSSVLYI